MWAALTATAHVDELEHLVNRVPLLLPPLLVRRLVPSRREDLVHALPQSGFAAQDPGILLADKCVIRKYLVEDADDESLSCKVCDGDRRRVRFGDFTDGGEHVFGQLG